ncbi:MAG: multidrug effflux MFS transporter [Nitratireductor sp.]
MSSPRFLDRTTHPHIMTLVMATAFGALAMNLFLPALPSMARYFNAEYATAQYAVSLYLAATAVLQLGIGPLSDRYGRRPVMAASIAIALLATLAGIHATSIEMFLAARIIQGTAIAGMVIARASIRDVVETSQAASKIGYVTMGMSLAPMIGPVIGGLLDEQFGWQSTFWLLFGFGLIAFLLVWFDMGETNTRLSSSFSAQFRSYPDLLGSRRFWGYSLTAAFGSGAFFAYLGGGPFLATDFYGLSPSQYGLYFAFVSLGYITGNFISGRYSARIGINRMTLMGGLTICIGMAFAIMLQYAGLRDPLAFFMPIAMVGLGNGITLPNANAGIVSVRPHLAGAASGLGGFIQVSGGAMLAVMAGEVLSHGSGPLPLLYLMLVSAMLSVTSTLFVIWVAAREDSKPAAN